MTLRFFPDHVRLSLSQGQGYLAIGIFISVVTQISQGHRYLVLRFFLLRCHHHCLRHQCYSPVKYAFGAKKCLVLQSSWGSHTSKFVVILSLLTLTKTGIDCLLGIAIQKKNCAAEILCSSRECVCDHFFFSPTPSRKHAHRGEEKGRKRILSPKAVCLCVARAQQLPHWIYTSAAWSIPVWKDESCNCWNRFAQLVLPCALIAHLGISGLGAAWLLSQDSNVEVTLFEQNDYVGGHTNTITVNNAHTISNERHPSPVPVDTGFIGTCAWWACACLINIRMREPGCYLVFSCSCPSHFWLCFYFFFGDVFLFFFCCFIFMCAYVSRDNMQCTMSRIIRTWLVSLTFWRWTQKQQTCLSHSQSTTVSVCPLFSSFSPSFLSLPPLTRLFSWHITHDLFSHISPLFLLS